MKASVRVDVDEDGNAELTSPKPRKLKPLDAEDAGNPQSGSPPLLKKSALKGAKGTPAAEDAAKAELTPVPPAGPPPAGNPTRSALRSKASPATDSRDEALPEAVPKSAMKSAMKSKKPVESQEEADTPVAAEPTVAKPALKSGMKKRSADAEPQEADTPVATEPTVAKPALKSGMKKRSADAEPQAASADAPPDDPPVAPPKSAMKSALKTRCEAAQSQESNAEITNAAPASAMKKSALKKTAPPPEQESSAEPALAPAAAKKSALKNCSAQLPAPESQGTAASVQLPAATKKKSAMKEADDQNVPRAATSRSRPSVFKMTVELVEDHAWGAPALCRHYYFMAGQRSLWQEQTTLDDMRRHRQVIQLEDDVTTPKEKRESGLIVPRTSKGLKRGNSMLIQSVKTPVKTVAPETILEKEVVHEISPLKDILLAKKPDADALRQLLKALPDRDKWINQSLDSTPPPMPAPLFQAVGGGWANLVEVLVENKVDVEAQYPGKSMLKGWIKPFTPLVECVRNRKSRFIGTMLGDKLDAIEQMLMSAAEAKKIAAGELPPPQKRSSKERSSKESPSEGTVTSGDESDDSMELTEAEALKAGFMTHFGSSTGSTAGFSSVPRKSVQLRGNRGRDIWHTQGHPNLKYELSTIFGTGSSSVREAFDSATGDGFAIKAGNKSAEIGGNISGKDPEAELWNEITTMRKLDHPNVIKLAETFEDDTHIFMVFEMCNGGELFERLVSMGSFAEATAFRLAYQMGGAIRHLHELRICHRDIQLETFIMKSDCPVENATVKLMDFSTSKEISDKLYTKVCTLHYVAPEILTSKNGYDEKVDIWSFGTLLYIMLCGSPPFDADSELDVLKAIKAGDYSFSPEAMWDPVTDEAKDAIRQTLVLDPAKRVDINALMQHPRLVKAEGAVAYTSDAASPSQQTSSASILRNAFQLMAEKFSDNQMQELRDLFRSRDKDRSGMVDVDAELRQCLERLVTNVECPKLMDLFQNPAFVGKVNYTLSLATMFDKRRHIKRQAARCVFDIFDVDGNGNVSMYEISQALAKGDGEDSELSKVKLKNITMSEVEMIWEEMRSVFSKAEVSDAEMTFEEFFRLLPNANQAISF